MIELNGIGKRFGAVEAVKSVSLHVSEGEFISLLGPSGCGKTTTLRLVAGFERPTSGSLRIANRDMTDVPIEQRGLSMVFQNYALFPHLTVSDNVAFGLKLRRLPKPEIEARVRQALDRVGLGQLGSRWPRQLSGGQQQRVSLARALVVNPSVLLMDEPLSNLDLKLREQLRDEIRSLQRELGITAIYVTHDQGEAMAMSDRIAVMNAGGIEQVGVPRDIYERPRTTFVASFIGHCNLMSGTLNASRAEFRTERGLVFNVVSGSGDRADQGTIRLAIRPEAVLFTRAGQGEAQSAGNNMLTGKVSDVIYLGNTAQVSVTLLTANGTEAETVNASWPIARGEAIPAVGDNIRLSVSASDCIPVYDRGA